MLGASTSLLCNTCRSQSDLAQRSAVLDSFRFDSDHGFNRSGLAHLNS